MINYKSLLLYIILIFRSLCIFCSENRVDSLQILLSDFARYRSEEQYALHLIKIDPQQAANKFQYLWDITLPKMEQQYAALCNSRSKGLIAILEQDALDNIRRVIDTTKELKTVYQQRLQEVKKREG